MTGRGAGLIPEVDVLDRVYSFVGVRIVALATGGAAASQRAAVRTPPYVARPHVAVRPSSSSSVVSRHPHSVSSSHPRPPRPARRRHHLRHPPPALPPRPAPAVHVRPRLILHVALPVSKTPRRSGYTSNKITHLNYIANQLMLFKTGSRQKGP